MNLRFLRTTLLILGTATAAPDLFTLPVDNELLVKWKEGPASSAVSDGNRRIGSSVQRSFEAIGWQQVALPAGMSVSAGIAAYQALGTVSAIEPTFSVQAMSAPLEPALNARQEDIGYSSELHSLATSLEPNDPRYRSQWHLKKVGLPAAWSVTTGSTNIVIAVFDTGVDYTHPDLVANMWRNPGESGLDANGHDKATNGMDDDENGYVDDVHGIDAVNGTGDPMDKGSWDPPALTQDDASYHGTFVAGVLGSVGNNALGTSGVNWSVQIMAIRIASGDRSQLRYIQTASSGTLAAYDYVLKMKRRGVNVRVVNVSFGGYVDSLAIRDALTQVGNEGILNVCASGNSATDQDLFPLLPGSSDLFSVINVASSTQTDTFRPSSNFGRSTVHLAAPGQDIVSTIKSPGYDTGNGNASPVVAGAAALLLSFDSSLTIAQLRAALFGSVDQFPSFRGKLITQGRLNVARALEYLTNPNPPAIVIYMSPAGPRTRPGAPIQVIFNRPMNRPSVEAAFAIEPPVSGTFQWSDDDQSFQFAHQNPFNSTTNYTVRILGSARDAEDGALDGNFNRAREGTPSDDFVWQFRFPVANDDFENAPLITGPSGSLRGSNRYTYLEVDEPRWFVIDDWRTYGASVWYKWASPGRGWFTFDLAGSGFNSLLQVYVKGPGGLDMLYPVAGNDDYGSRQTSRISFRADAESTYWILVAGKSEFDPQQAGSFTLSWYPTPSPGFTGPQLTLSNASPGGKITLTGTNFTGATAVLFNGASASFTNAPTNNFDLRITAIVPPDAISGPITVVTPHGNVTSTALFQVLPPPLRITLASASEIIVSWSSTSREFILETNEQIQGAAWVPLPEMPVIGNDGSSIAIALEPRGRFLRLRKASP